MSTAASAGRGFAVREYLKQCKAFINMYIWRDRKGMKLCARSFVLDLIVGIRAL